MMKVKQALLSVSDKTGIVDFARKLHELGVRIISTGGTMKTLQDADIPVTYISDVTHFPEMMDGRVKTLHPFIHGGILAVRDDENHRKAMEEHGISGIDLVVVNLYPFRQTIAKSDVTLAEAIENIDIGGPAMIRSAAKNFRFVGVVVNPARYDQVLAEMTEQGEITDQTRMTLAREAYSHTAAYDSCITEYLAAQLGEGSFPVTIHPGYEKIQDLRYGENPHQTAAFYKEQFSTTGIASAKQLHGKELSFNNIVDIEAAYGLVSDFEEPAAAIIKHTNPCGTGIGASLSESYKKALASDPVSAYGGIVALNRSVDQATAEEISHTFMETVIAPAFDEEALAILTKKKNLRLLTAPLLDEVNQAFDKKKVSGGLLVQQADRKVESRASMSVATNKIPTEAEWEQLLFAWKVVKHVKSNAIVVAGNSQTYGVGAGQMNRVGSAEIALKQAGEKSQGAVLSSDAFFPFRDSIDTAAKAGITAIIQPGGSIRDQECIDAANEHGIAMVFTGIRHFKH
jgi:phosphoribosylaminoimidazolecarboxamide formyltransferase / IMP cyclohydrolase